MPTRSKDTYQEHIYAFTDEILVDCPTCGKQAMVLAGDFLSVKSNSRDVKLVCESCGHSKYLEGIPNVILSSSDEKAMVGKHLIIGAPVDPFFHEPLRLRKALSLITQTAEERYAELIETNKRRSFNMRN